MHDDIHELEKLPPDQQRTIGNCLLMAFGVKILFWLVLLALLIIFFRSLIAP